MFGYAIHDKKAGMYHPPMFFHHDVQAVRSVERTAKSPGNQLSEYPQDFALVCVCEFIENTGEMLRIDQRLVVEVASLVEKVSKNEPA